MRTVLQFVTYVEKTLHIWVGLNEYFLTSKQSYSLMHIQ